MSIELMPRRAAQVISYPVPIARNPNNIDALQRGRVSEVSRRQFVSRHLASAAE